MLGLRMGRRAGGERKLDQPPQLERLPAQQLSIATKIHTQPHGVAPAHQARANTAAAPLFGSLSVPCSVGICGRFFPLSLSRWGNDQPGRRRDCLRGRSPCEGDARWKGEMTKVRTIFLAREHDNHYQESIPVASPGRRDRKGWSW